MNRLLAVIVAPIDRPHPHLRLLLSSAVLAAALLAAAPGQAQSAAYAEGTDQTTLSLTEAQLRVDELDRELLTLADEREALANELDQYKRTLAILQRDGTAPEQSSNPAVRTLALEMVTIRERLISVTEREVTLLQEQITRARQLAAVAPPMDEGDAATTGADRASAGIESKPLRTHNREYSIERESENVKRLHALLASYYAELQESARTLPSEEELANRAAAQVDAERLARIPFSPDKVRLNGAEGSTALSQITRRLSDPNIPESRRDMAPICAVKTRLFGSLIASETRSLKPVGKNHFVARLRLQPGDTTLRIMDERWEIQLPEHANAGEFLITLYRPPGGNVELHLFALADLLAEADPHIPAWLPAELNLNSRAG